MAERETATSTPARQERSLARRDLVDPFGIMRRFTDEVDRLFDDFGFGRRTLGFPFEGLLGRGRRRGAEMEMDVWNPDIDVFQRDNELVIRADLPGVNKGDVKVEVTEDSVMIQGERRREKEEEREGLYRMERSYGSFYRQIPLPEGAITEQAKATFKDGVLEIVMPAPPEQAGRGRRLEIAEESSQPGGSASKK